MSKGLKGVILLLFSTFLWLLLTHPSIKYRYEQDWSQHQYTSHSSIPSVLYKILSKTICHSCWLFLFVSLVSLGPVIDSLTMENHAVCLKSPRPNPNRNQTISSRQFNPMVQKAVIDVERAEEANSSGVLLLIKYSEQNCVISSKLFHQREECNTWGNPTMHAFIRLAYPLIERL